MVVLLVPDKWRHLAESENRPLAQDLKVSPKVLAGKEKGVDGIFETSPPNDDIFPRKQGKKSLRISLFHR